MSIKKIITGLLLSLLLNIEAVNADGNELLANCQLVINGMDSGKPSQDSLSNFKSGQCIGVSLGARTTMHMYQTELKDGSLLHACFPAGGINNGQAVRIITSYLKKNPDKLHMNAVPLAVLAFLYAYPCK
jgi:hypothetical protein